jgi:hypothetical protein
LDYCYLEKAHNTVNVPVKESEIFTIIDSLKNTVSWKYKKPDYRFLTTAFFGNQSEKLEIYSKVHQLEEREKELFKIISDKSHKLRTEYKLDTVRKLRKIYNNLIINSEKEILFQAALKNKNSEKVLLYVVDSLKFGEKEESLFNSSFYFIEWSESGVSIDSIAKCIGYAGIFERFNCSENILREFLKIKIPNKGNRPRTYKKIIREYERAKGIDSISEKIDSKEIALNFKERLIETIKRECA